MDAGIARPETPSGQYSSPTASALSSLWNFVLSSDALRDGAKLILIGSILELARRIVSMAWVTFMEFFFITAEFEDRDETFTWMMFWLSRQPKWNKLRSIRVTTFRHGQSGVSNIVPGEPEEKKAGPSRRLAYVLSYNKAFSMWYKRTWVSIAIMQTQGDMWNRRGDERLKITLFTRNTARLNDLLLEAKLSYREHSEGRINIFVSDANNEWSLAGSRPKRKIASVVLDKKIKKQLLEDAKDFIASEKWYADRGIPWRRGYLLHGVPGSGKTSLIHSVAGELGLDVYVVTLSKKSLDDSTLNELISKIPQKSLAIMEDIDAAFLHGVNRENDSLGVPLMPGQPPGDPSTQSLMQSASGVTLSGLLGAIDGVAAQEGRLLFATTNKYNALDPALIRSGRLDVHIRFENAGKHQAAELFRCFFRPVSGDDSEANNEEESGDELQWDSVSSTAVGSVPGSPTRASYSSVASIGSPVLNNRANSAMRAKDIDVDWSSLPWRKVKQLSYAFAERIPEREFSMAALQGLLMQYKTSPYDAIAKVDTWISDERRKRAEREGRMFEPEILEKKCTEPQSTEVNEGDGASQEQSGYKANQANESLPGLDPLPSWLTAVL